MNLGDWLKAQGVSARDVRKAVKQARDVTQTVEVVAAVAEKALSKLAAKQNVGKKTQAVAVLGVKVAGAVRKGAADMLTERKR